MLNVHFSRVADLAGPDHIVIMPSVPISCYRDGFGNWCSRILAPAGHVRLSTDAVVTDSGQLDPVVPGAGQIAVEKLPDEAIVFLLASRFCDSDRLLDLAWIQRYDARLGARPGDLRFCSSAHQFRLRAREGDEDSLGSLPGRAGSLSRLCASGGGVLPGLEYSGPLLHWISGRRRHPATLSAGRFRGLVRGLSRRTMVYVRCAQQCP
jgi:hypothetical protein